ncbi:TPA: IS3 family transposase [Streptococcus agalactiae]|nr:IS3 family transposase [Streptococcus agalactiae]
MYFQRIPLYHTTSWSDLIHVPDWQSIDNAPTESFFGFFKTESYHLKKYNSYDELVNDVARYIEFYNTQRYQSKLNNLTPLEFRNQVA